MRILALDLAKLTGWAVGSPAGVEAFGTHLLPSTAAWELGEYGMAARVLFRRMLAHVEPDWVVYESPILRSGKIVEGRRGPRVATIDTPDKLRKMYGLPFELEIECRRAGVPVREANIGAWRKSFLMGKIPKGREACKLAVKVMARRRGWDVKDDNEADALAVLDYELGMKCANQMAVRRINAGPSATMSSSGPAVFAGSRVFFPPATRTAEPATPESGTAGISSASSTGQKSASETMEIIRPSAAAMSSTSSRSPAPQLSLGQPASRRREWKR